MHILINYTLRTMFGMLYDTNKQVTICPAFWDCTDVSFARLPHGFDVTRSVRQTYCTVAYQIGLYGLVEVLHLLSDMLHTVDYQFSGINLHYVVYR